jgi:CDP-diacylglycerol--inositol 3-phosphatidyltransferase
VSTAGFLVVLAGMYPEYYFHCAMLVVLDIASHWMHVMSVSGHHKSKEVLLNRNALLQWYYSIYPLFGYCCVGAELFYIIGYVLFFYYHPILYQVSWRSGIALHYIVLHCIVLYCH